VETAAVDSQLQALSAAKESDKALPENHGQKDIISYNESPKRRMVALKGNGMGQPPEVVYSTTTTTISRSAEAVKNRPSELPPAPGLHTKLADDLVSTNSILGRQISLFGRISISLTTAQMPPCTQRHCIINCQELCSQQDANHHICGIQDNELEQFVQQPAFPEFTRELFHGLFHICSENDNGQAHIQLRSDNQGSISASPIIIAREIIVWLQFPVNLCFARVAT